RAELAIHPRRTCTTFSRAAPSDAPTGRHACVREITRRFAFVFETDADALLPVERGRLRRPQINLEDQIVAERRAQTMRARNFAHRPVTQAQLITLGARMRWQIKQPVRALAMLVAKRGARLVRDGEVREVERIGDEAQGHDAE